MASVSHESPSEASPLSIPTELIDSAKKSGSRKHGEALLVSIALKKKSVSQVLPNDTKKKKSIVTDRLEEDSEEKMVEPSVVTETQSKIVAIETDLFETLGIKDTF